MNNFLAASKGKKGGDPNPLYYKLQLAMQSKIESGEWSPGDKIPPERKLAAEYKVSLGTIRKAILNLVSEGFLFRVQGKGTMVAGTTMIRENLRYYCFLKEFDRKEAVLKISLLDIEVIDGQERINKLLKLKPEDKLYRIRRRFAAQQRPIIYTVSYLPYNMFEGLENFSRFRLEKVPIYISVEDNFGIPTISNKELVTADSCDEELAKILEVPTNTPFLKIEMLSMTHKKRPYEYRLSHCLTDRGGIYREY